MELRRSIKTTTGVLAATMLGIVLAAGCGQSDDPAPKEAVRGVTTVRESPATTTQSDATREMLNEMRRRIAEVKDGTAGTR